MPEKLKLWLPVFFVLAVLLVECRSDKLDKSNVEDKEETFETHLWSRLSKDHSSSKSRSKRDVADHADADDGSLTTDDRRSSRSLLSTTTSTENDDNDARPGDKLPPILEKVSPKVSVAPLV